MSEKNRLRTPAQVAAAIHAFLDYRAESCVDSALEADYEWLNSRYEAEEYRESRKTGIVADYLQSVEIDRWTRTEDAMPDKDGDYLAVVSYITIPVIAQFTTWMGVNAWVNGNGFAGEHISHWMPLPSRPAAASAQAVPPEPTT